MIDQLEHDVRAVFAEDAAAAPVATDLAAAARRRVWRHRSVRAAWVAVPLAAASAVVVAVTTGALSLGGEPADDLVVAPTKRVESAEPLPEPSTDPNAITGSGGLQSPVDSVALCLQYTPETLGDAGFAFDGTVSSIESAPGLELAPGAILPQATVTFTAHEWFRAGAKPSITVTMTPPDGHGWMEDYAVPKYGVGTRLLVSGFSRARGAPLDDPVASGCSFTRYYDDATAAEWRAVFE